MQSISKAETRGLKRKFAGAHSQSIKKAHHTEECFAEDRLHRKATVATSSGQVENAKDDISNSDLSSYSGSDDESDHDAAVNTPPTPYSPNPSPRFPSELKTHLCTYADCGKAFNRPAKLAQHILSHTNSRPFVCPHKPCTKDFLRQSHLKHHVKSAHSDVRDYACEWEGCGKKFITATRLKRHYAAHEGREKFRCCVYGCGQTFRKHGTLQKHIVTVHEGRKAFQCELQDEDGNLCGQGFDTSGKLRAHEGRVHGGKRFWCSMCSSNTLEMEPTANQTSIAGAAGFSTYAELKEHIKNDHPPQCNICGLVCNSQRDLKNHAEVQHGKACVGERKTHPCPESGCGRAFTKKGNLNAHIQSAHKAKRYVCGEVELASLNSVDGWDGLDACGRALSTKGSLENHIRTTHMGMGRRRLKTTQKYIPDPAQEQHDHNMNLLKLTGVGYEEYSGRHIACLIPGCGFRFGRDYDLQVHLVSRHNLSEHEAEISITGAGESFHYRIAGNYNLPDDPKHNSPYGYSNIQEDNIPDGGFFWIGNDFDEPQEGEDGEWLRDEKEMQNLINRMV
ncbi:MAG: hypothetical protein Q9225_002154 [Loekoesia sp. 1 TL-2023]